jgi:hypothetical protein
MIDRRLALAPFAALLLTAAACNGDGNAALNGEPDDAEPAAERLGPQDQFFANLAELCGNAYRGELVDASETGGDFEGQELVMHVRQCTDDEIHIPFHVGDNRSRTWIISRIDDGLRLKHDHRYEDGTEEELTQYGGDTTESGTAHQQEFHADRETADMLPAAATNVWTVEVHPGDTYAYALRREGTERRVRVEFDLSETVEAPPAPWGHEDTQPYQPAGAEEAAVDG